MYRAVLGHSGLFGRMPAVGEGSLVFGQRGRVRTLSRATDSVVVVESHTWVDV